MTENSIMNDISFETYDDFIEHVLFHHFDEKFEEDRTTAIVAKYEKIVDIFSTLVSDGFLPIAASFNAPECNNYDKEYLLILDGIEMFIEPFYSDVLGDYLITAADYVYFDEDATSSCVRSVASEQKIIFSIEDEDSFYCVGCDKACDNCDCKSYGKSDYEEEKENESSKQETSAIKKDKKDAKDNAVKFSVTINGKEVNKDEVMKHIDDMLGNYANVMASFYESKRKMREFENRLWTNDFFSRF